MKRSNLYILWGFLYILCACMGALPEQTGFVRVLMLAIALLFFVPPAILLYDARQRKDPVTRRVLFWISLGSLALTLLLMIGNILSVFGGDTLGNVMHILLALVSVPMLCSGYWAVSLFAWAVLMLTAAKK